MKSFLIGLSCSLEGKKVLVNIHTRIDVQDTLKIAFQKWKESPLIDR
jgi:hypothetical protein